MQLLLLPQPALAKLCAVRGSSYSGPSLCQLDCPSLTHLKLNYTTLVKQAEEMLLQQQSQLGKLAEANTDPTSLPGTDSSKSKGSRIVMQLLQSIVQGNSSLQVLKLDGLTVAAAQSLGGLLHDASSNNSSTFMGGPCLMYVNGLPIPVQALLGSSSGPVLQSASPSPAGKLQFSVLQELDLSDRGAMSAPYSCPTPDLQHGLQVQTAQVLTEPHTEFLAALLPACSSLLHLKLPWLAPDVSEEACSRLMAAVLQLPALQTFNGLLFSQPLQAASREITARDEVQRCMHQALSDCMQSSGSFKSSLGLCECSSGPGSGMQTKEAVSCQKTTLDLRGRPLGAVGAALLGRALAHHSSLCNIGGLLLSGKSTVCMIHQRVHYWHSS